MAGADDNSTLLLVDDDEGFLDVLAAGLQSRGYDVQTCADGEEALRQLEAHRPDLLVCDINMPRLDGFSVCRELREAGDELPVILLTTRDNDVDEALGLQLGADDYVTKPFSQRVLVARIEALLRRQAMRSSSGPSAADECLVHGPLTVDKARLAVTYHDEEIEFTVTEFRLLVGFMERAGLVLSRDRLLALMREDSDTFVHDRMVDSYVGRLRRKLSAIHDDFEAIETVVGAGYRWREDAL